MPLKHDTGYYSCLNKTKVLNISTKNSDRSISSQYVKTHSTSIKTRTHFSTKEDVNINHLALLEGSIYKQWLLQTWYQKPKGNKNTKKPRVFKLGNTSEGSAFIMQIHQQILIIPPSDVINKERLQYRRQNGVGERGHDCSLVRAAVVRTAIQLWQKGLEGKERG